MKISLEFGHTSLALIDRIDIKRSAIIAQSLVPSLQRMGHDVSTVVLFDDKRVHLTERESLAKELLELLDEYGCRPNAWFFERNLGTQLEVFAELLPPRPRRRLLRTAHNYMREYQSLPCSVDIALWHALRLGLLDPDPTLGVAHLNVSILGDSNREHEERAAEHYLNYVSPGGRPLPIVNIYYPESTSRSLDPQFALAQLTTTVEELQGAEHSNH